MKNNKNLLHWGTARKILQWCMNHYGRSKYNGGYPSLRYIDTEKYENFNEDGFYEDIENIIYVNSKSKNIKNLEELVRTVIHEYAHYKYHPMGKYYKLAEKYNNFDHPYEIQARQIEDRDTKKCLSYLRHNFGF